MAKEVQLRLKVGTTAELEAVAAEDGIVRADTEKMSLTIDNSEFRLAGGGGGVTVPGKDGREVELRNNGEYIQWRYVGEQTWQNLISVADITGTDGADGEKGSNGADGKSVELRVESGYLQWRQTDGVWTNLIELASLAVQGEKGSDGYSPVISVKSNTADEYKLTVTNKDGSFDTPNLKSSGGGSSGGSGVLPYQGTGLVVLGDSISVFAGSNITAISSDSSGTVTLTCSLSPAARVGEMISINFVEPAEFNGHFRVESVSGSTYTVKNALVAKDTTGTVMSGFLNRFACNLAQHTMNWVMFGHMFAQNRPPLKAVIAQSSIGIQPFIDNFEKLVKPHNPEYVVIALGANDVMTTDAHLTAAIEKCKTLLNLIVKAGMKPIASLLPPRRADSTSAANTHKYNQWLKAYCLAKGIPFVNFYGALVDQKDGNTPSNYMTDAVHPNMDGHYRMGEAFAETAGKIFTDDIYLPETNYENLANGLNLFDDPLMLGTPVAATATGMSGMHLAETKASRGGTGSEAVASIVPRSDGYGNNVKAVINIPSYVSVGATYATITSSKTIDFTADKDYYLIAMFSGKLTVVEAGTIDYQRGSYKITVNGVALDRNVFTVQASAPSVIRAMDGKEIVMKSTPILLRAGDAVSGTVSITHAIYGSGKFELEMGRVAFRLIPADRFVY